MQSNCIGHIMHWQCYQHFTTNVMKKPKKYKRPDVGITFQEDI